MNELTHDRLTDLKRFYDLLAHLENNNGAKLNLGICNGKMNWPKQGIYFFCEAGESRTESGKGCRAVRVGTHALRKGAKSTLWRRLTNHKGSRSGKGNHRGSIFRLLVGISLANRNNEPLPKCWGDKKARRKTMSELELNAENELEKDVSDYICAMPFICLNVSSDAGPRSDRAFIERNAIALLSNCHEPVVDQSSSNWLGRYCDRELVRCSGLWNQEHVTEQYDASFLDVMENWVIKTEPV